MKNPSSLLIGIDPSQRHTGICVIVDGGEPIFHEIAPSLEECPVLLDSLLYLRRETRNFLATYFDRSQSSTTEVLLGMEKQVGGGNMSMTLFSAQMTIWGVFQAFLPPNSILLVNPLPIQLKSYMRKRFGVDLENKSAIVESFKKQYGTSHNVDLKRISSHKVEAWYLTQMAKEVKNGTWAYTPPSKEKPLVTWKTLYGQK